MLNAVMATNEPKKLNEIVLDNINTINSSNKYNSDTKIDLLVDRIHDQKR